MNSTQGACKEIETAKEKRGEGPCGYTVLAVLEQKWLLEVIEFKFNFIDKLRSKVVLTEGHTAKFAIDLFSEKNRLWLF